MSKLIESYGKITGQQIENARSDVNLVASDITLPVNPDNAHSFAGVEFYNDANGDTPLDPSTLTGTATITVKTVNQPIAFQEVSNGTLDISTAIIASWDANATAVKATLAAVTGATHYRLIVSTNRS